MKFISEEQSAALITHDIAYAAAREALIAAASEEATVFPAVLAHGSSPSDRFSINRARRAISPGSRSALIGRATTGSGSLAIIRRSC